MMYGSAGFLAEDQDKGGVGRFACLFLGTCLWSKLRRGGGERIATENREQRTENRE